MIRKAPFMALAFGLILVTPLAAQEQSGTGSAEELSTGVPVGEAEPQVGQPYIAQEHGDWDIRCIRAAESPEQCQLYQLLSNDDGAALAEINIFLLPPGQQAEAGATIITPLETLLTEQMTLSIDGAPGRRYPFSFCTQAGCFSRIGLTGDDLAAFRRGTTARVRVVPAAARDREVIVNVSLSGFTAAYAALGDLAGN